MDSKMIKGPADAARVNVNEPYEVKYWCEKFRCTPDQLKEVVQKVGVAAKNVEQELRRR